MNLLEILGAFALFFLLLGLGLWHAGVLKVRVKVEIDKDGEA